VDLGLPREQRDNDHGAGIVAWNRGFVVCKNEIADAIEIALAAQCVVARLTTLGGETAFAFAGRSVPTFDADGCFLCAVDGRNSGYSHSRTTPFHPSRLIPKLGLTFGITLRTRDADLRCSSPELAALWRALDPESESSSADGLTAFRWDLDGCRLDDPRIAAHTLTLRAIQRWLDDQKIPNRTAFFDEGWPEVSGELPAMDDVFTGPATCLTLEWISRAGDLESVTANDAEFVVDGDGLPDSELWAL